MLHFLQVLGIAVCHFADGGRAETDLIRCLLYGVAHEITVKCALSQRVSQFIFWQCEMVHADGKIACLQQTLPCQGEECVFMGCIGSRQRIQRLLVRKPGRQMGVTVNGNAVGTHVNNLSDGARPALFLLQGKPIDEVNVDAPEAEFTAQVYGAARLRCCLVAADGLLHRWIQVLYAKTDAVETDCGKTAQLLLCHRGRIRFNGNFSVRLNVKGGGNGIPKQMHLAFIERGGGAAAPMALG